jgi:acyl-homoserine lactone acylase PvdQ
MLRRFSPGKEPDAASRRAGLARLLAFAALSPSAGARPDVAYDILAPDQLGGLPLSGDSTDQIPRYDGLTPLRGRVGPRDIRRLYKRADLRPRGPTRRERTGRRGLRIVRDRFGVPHIYGRRRSDAWYGAGWVTAEDRGLLLQLGRGPARAAVADIPGVDAFGLVTSGRSFVPRAQAEALVSAQRRKLVRAYGCKGRRILRDLRAYAAGLSTYLRRSGSSQPPWTVNDVLAIVAFIGSIFGNGGGSEVRNSEFLARLRASLGRRRGAQAFVDLMEADDPAAPTTTRRPFPYGRSGGTPTAASPLVDPGSIQDLAPAAPRVLASNFLVTSPWRSRTRESIFVAGPQLGYFYPEIVLEADLHAPGLRARGVLVPGGGPYVLIGRTRDYAWSLTTAQNDNRDQFLERLCEPNGARPTRDSRHYVYKGRCRAMRTFDAGTLDGERVRFPVTVHGPVSGTAMVRGRPYAIARKRSTYGRDGLSIAALRDMTLGRGRTVGGFWRSANEFEFTFSWGYAGRRRTAYFCSGRLPRRARGTNKLLPTLGSGRYDWRGFVPLRRHPHDVGGPRGLFLNWNNKPAPRWQPGDDVHGYGSVHRVELLSRFPRRARLRDVVGVMNRAATQDLRAVRLWPVVRAVLRTGRAPDARTARATALVTAWQRRGASRVDRNLDGKLDDPGAAVMDAAFEPIADAVMTPVLGSLREELARLQRATTRPIGGTAPRSATAGTATSTRTCGRCSAARSAGRSTCATAAGARWPPAAPRFGPSSRPRSIRSPRRRVQTRRAGAPTPSRSESTSCPA